MVDITTTLATVKAIAGVAKEAGKIALYNDIISLQSTIMEMIADNTQTVQENAKLTRENVDLRDRVSELERQLTTRDEMEFRKDAYWRVREGKPDEGPFCQKCFDGQGKISWMTDRGNGFTCCAVCSHCIGRATQMGTPFRGR